MTKKMEPEEKQHRKELYRSARKSSKALAQMEATQRLRKKYNPEYRSLFKEIYKGLYPLIKEHHGITNPINKRGGSH